jgi:hypothetical protein
MGGVAFGIIGAVFALVLTVLHPMYFELIGTNAALLRYVVLRCFPNDRFIERSPLCRCFLLDTFWYSQLARRSIWGSVERGQWDRSCEQQVHLRTILALPVSLT